MANKPKLPKGLDIWIDAQELLKFVQNTNEAPPVLESATSRALNSIGEKLVSDVATAVAAQTGVSEDAVRNRIVVIPSTPSDLTYKINASEALIQGPADRPMRMRRKFTQRPTGYFHAEELVQIVTMGDEQVCQVCQDLEEGGPYTIEDARSLIPAHPHCRCLVQSYHSRRELPVAFKKGKSAEVASVRMQELSEKIVKEAEVALKVLYNAR